MRPFLTVFLLVTWASHVFAASLEEETQRYLEIFRGDKALHSDAADTFPWMGLSDTALFDVIEKRLLEDYDAARSDRAEKNRVARYIRSLGFSGQPKYEPTLRKFVADRTYQRYALAALEDLPRYEKWNRIIADRRSFDSRYDDDVNRVINMLKSDDIGLKGLAAKRIYFAHAENDMLLDLLAQELQRSYSVTDPALIDAVGWMAKTVGRSARERFKPVLQEVYAKAEAPKIRRHADAGLRHYSR